MTDAAVVGRIAAGDRAAMAELYDRYADVVFSLACRIMRVPAEAEDVVQEVFTQAWRQAGRYDAGRALGGGVAAEHDADAGDRSAARRARRGSASAARTTSELTPAGGDDSGAQAIGGERAARVRAALSVLGEAQRQAIDLAYFGGLRTAKSRSGWRSRSGRSRRASAAAC